MSLHRIKAFDPDYRHHFDDRDLVGFDFYSANDKIGSVDDLLVDDEGQFRYLVINTGAWIFGKKVLLPIGQARIDYNQRRTFADGLTRAQVEALPAFTNESNLDYGYEERVRGAYRPLASDRDLDRTVASSRDERDGYRYEQDPALYGMNERDHQSLKLYEERLIAHKRRQKTGEVAVGKHVETEPATVQVPVAKERVVIERTADAAGRPVAVGEATFDQGEVARVEVYEETPDIHKEAFVREAVSVRKEVKQETVHVED
ncbi:DUF2382 domain-containing protein [Leptolyngbya sp. FACHB-321]|uniref:PRC and DUF2382 domain-containing protein n=1 Tax=Leptolyngbya sp. FACHB-321 TaxID=2692807 RepID=UPI001687F839|nr:DUF2382 domain-containing protein [Leptolyngbya sp. FACHB-321]MBD2034127.1 DUF2382 domain-containing protein [Leptolyngbya sp. FACHB-321]